MSAPNIPLRDHPAVRDDRIMVALFEDLRLHLRPGDVPMVTELPRGNADRWRVWIRHDHGFLGGHRTFGPPRPTLAQAIDSLIAKLR